MGKSRGQPSPGLVRYYSFQRIPHVSAPFHRVLDDIFCQLLLVSLRFHTIPAPSVTRHSVEHSGCFVQYIKTLSVVPKTAS